MGDTYGYWRVVSPNTSRTKGGSVASLCVCDCGTQSEVRNRHLVTGKSKSCGCKSITLRAKSLETHGLSKTKLYHRWESMKLRCSSHATERWPRYGGRGIRVCDEWQAFSPFAEWAFANGYSPELSLDRIDNDGHYEPNNCRWVGRSEQQRNRHNNRLIQAFGESKIAKDWAEDPRCQVALITLTTRIYRGWDDQKAVETPSRRRETHP